MASGGQDAASGGQGMASGGQDAASGGQGMASGGSSHTATPSIGCSATDVVTGDSIDATLTVGVDLRTYRLSVPTDYQAGEALPLVFGLNGVGGDGKGAQSAFNLESGHRAIFVYPDSLFKESSNAVDWDYARNGIDVAFFDALYAELTENYCVNLDQVFALGVSAGGIMSNKLGCFRGDVITGIAPASAMTWGETCTGSVGVMVICGSQDTFNPCAEDAAEEVRIWSEENSCEASSTASSLSEECAEYAGCNPEAPLLLCEHPGGHMWPQSASDYAWDFFMSL